MKKIILNLIMIAAIMLSNLASAQQHKRFYHNNGKLKYSGLVKNGERQGEWKTYFKNGQLGGIESFVNGKMHGEVKYYYSSGNLFTNSMYKNGKKDQRNK